MNDLIYEQIARKNGTTTENVKREIQAMINATYKKPNAYAQSVPRENDVPTIEEFTSFIFMEILLQKKK